MKPFDDDPSTASIEHLDQDEAFCAAMLRAVDAGLERVPMLGVDTRPGTKNPRLLLPGQPLR